jgi:hypothetical protein
MPWHDLRVMTDADLKAIYAYTRSLGPAAMLLPQTFRQVPSLPSLWCSFTDESPDHRSWCKTRRRE